MTGIKALVIPELLRWVRNRATVKLESAAKAAHVPVERLQAWEREDSDEAPTLAQLRELAAKYHFPLAVFYLPGLMDRCPREPGEPARPGSRESRVCR